jgi:hypothetical protein
VDVAPVPPSAIPKIFFAFKRALDGMITPYVALRQAAIN